MKTRNIILLALSALFTAACHTWDEPSVVEGRNSYGNQYLQESNVVTVADLKADFKDVISSGSLKQVTKPTQIKVIVTGNDEGSNIYKTLYVADKTGGISLSINKSGIFSEAPVGQCMLIELKDLYIGGYGQQPQIGILYQKDENTQQVGRMDRYTWQEHFKLLPDVKGLSVKPIKTNDMGMLDLDRDFGKVVTLVGVTMKDADGVKVFAPSDGSVKLSGGCANREVANQSTTVYVRTSTYAKFATMAMPTEKINITGILSRFANDVQIMPRTIDDIQPYDGLDYESTWKPTDPEGDGSQAKPFNVTAAIAKCQEVGATVSSQKYYIKGYVAADAEVNSQYGNITFEMADSKDGGVRFTAYQMAGSDGKKLADNFKLSKGDEVVICGKVVNYNGSKPETEGQGKSIIVSVNGKDTNGKTTSGGSDDDTPTPTGDTDGTEAKPYTVTDAIAADTGTSVFVKAYIVGWIDGKTLAEGAKFNGEATVATNIMIAASADETDLSKCMPVQLPSGAVRTAVNLQDNPGNYKKEILLVGNIEKYFGATGVKGVSYAKIGNTEAGTKPGGSSTGGGTSSSDVQIITVAQFNAAAVSTDVWYQLTGTVKNLKDDDKYGNFDLEDETGSVYVYGLLSEKGGAKQKFQDLVTAKGIANGKKITIIGNRGVFNEKIEVLNAYFVSIQ